MIKKICVVTLVGMTGLGFFSYAQTAAPQTPPSAQDQAAATVSDQQIAKIVETVNDAEIDAGMRAQSKATNPQVRDFGTMMVKQHRTAEDTLKKVVQKNSISMADSDLNKSLKEELKGGYKDLKKAKKETFDKTYMDQQVAMHQKTLDLLDATLIPNAKNTEFKTQLQKIREDVRAHLDHAKTVQSKLQ